MRHYNWCDDQAAMSSVAYGLHLHRHAPITWLVSDPRRRRILLTKRRGTRLFRTIQLYDRRPAIRGGGHDPRAAGTAAVKTRLVVVAVVLLQHLGRDHIGREDAGCIYQTGPRAKALPAAREHREAAPRIARAFRARGEGHFFCAAVARLSFRRRARFSAACALFGGVRAFAARRGG